MDPIDATDVERWRLLDRHVQGIDGAPRIRAQAVVDVAENTRGVAAHRGTDPLNDLLELYAAVSSHAAQLMVSDAMRYLRADREITQIVAGQRARTDLTVLD